MDWRRTQGHDINSCLASGGKKNVGKGENADNQHFFLFQQCLFICLQTMLIILIIHVHVFVI